MRVRVMNKVCVNCLELNPEIDIVYDDGWSEAGGVRKYISGRHEECTNCEQPVVDVEHLDDETLNEWIDNNLDRVLEITIPCYDELLWLFTNGKFKQVWLEVQTLKGLEDLDEMMDEGLYRLSKSQEEKLKALDLLEAK